MSQIVQLNNTNYMDLGNFYCGCYYLDTPRTKLIKLMGLFKTLIGINRACFIHDKHYNFIFPLPLNILTFLMYKLAVDTIFLLNCFKFARKNIYVLLKYCLAIIFYIIVIVATPIYYVVYKKWFK